MNLRTVLAAAAVLAVSSPVLAQETPAQPPAEAVQMTPAQQAFMVRDQAFRTELQGMFGQIQTALQDSATNGAQKQAAVDAILTSHTPAINAFADELNTFLVAERAAATDPAVQAEIDAAIAAAPGNVRRLPETIRAQVAQAIAAAEAEAAAAAAGTPPAQAGDGAVAGQVPVQ